MTCDEFLSLISARGAILAPPVSESDIAQTNSNLQHMRAAILPMFMIDLYHHTGGIMLDTGYIFGPHEIENGARTPVPGILDINRDMSVIPGMVGKTIFGRNDLFYFAFDAFGTCYMMDNLSLRILRKYDDAHKAMIDCLIAGKF